MLLPERCFLKSAGLPDAKIDPADASLPFSVEKHGLLETTRLEHLEPTSHVL